MNTHKIAVAVDGPAGAGKSSISRIVAKKLGYLYIDTGAMYRSVTWAVLHNHIDVHNQKAVEALLPELDLTMEASDDSCKVFIAGQDVTDYIRTPQVNNAVSIVASYKGVRTGNVADFSSFSFHAVKNFTTAEGGCATWRHIDGIDDETIYKQFQLLSLHGQDKDALAKTKAGAWEYDIIGPWYKCNMTDIMAAIGLRQLDRYPGMLARRREIVSKYDEMCDELGVKHLNHWGKDFESSKHLYLTRILGISDEQRREIIIKLAERGVNTNVHYKPLPMMTAYKTLGWDIKDFPNAYAYYENLITLPLHTKLSDEDVEYVIENFKEIVKEYM